MSGSRALVIWPPQILSYFNAGHHTLLYSVSNYLRELGVFHQVDTLDASVESTTWKEIGDRLHQGNYDVIAVTNDLDGVDGLSRFLSYTRELSPRSRVLTFGRLSGMRADLFTRFDLDGIAGPGDYEPAVAAFAELALLGWDSAHPIPGVHVRIDNRWHEPTGPSAWLPPEQWVLPDISEIPYACYNWLYRDDQNKFCGIPDRLELVVPVARGCPVGCAFCEVPVVFGRSDRRISVHRTVSYIQESFASLPFEYVAFYAPTFTLDRNWVSELCAELVALGSRFPWKCATTMHHLDQDLVGRMGASGCVRISVGVETTEPDADGALPRIKRKGNTEIEELASWCGASGIELNCFVIVGLPGTSVTGAEDTIMRLRHIGARVRPTIYCPHELVSTSMSTDEISLFNRQILRDDTISGPAERQRAYDIVFGVERRKTQVAGAIARREAAPDPEPAPGAHGMAVP
jgi:anaerobic magnesium-protoporphyrin IX monomethyl ester cyclase